MTESDSRPEGESDPEELVWPPPVSADDIIWLEPGATLPALDAPESASGTPPAAAVDDRPESASETPHVAVVEFPAALPISYCLSPEVAFEWHDAVAIVQQLAEQLTRGLRGDPAGSLPDVGRITIDRTGRLSVTLERTGDGRLARGLGYLLHQLLTDRDGPVALRLIVSQVVSDLPTIGSVEELTRALARWERPNRTEKLKQVYERVHAIASRRPQALVPTPEVVAARPEATVQETPQVEPATLAIADAAHAAAHAIRAWIESHRTVALSAVVVAFVVFVVAVGLSMFSGPDRPPISLPANAPTPRVAESVAPSPDYWLPGRITLARTAFGSASPPPTRLVPTPAQPRSSDLAVAGFIAQAPREEPTPQTAPQTVPPNPRPGPTPTSTVATDAPEHIYTGSDPGVVEAVLVKPYLPEHPDPGTPPELLGVLELVINRAGGVESVRLQSPFNRYRERWWVYVAKNWIFRPALKDGQPVMSLKRIVITDVRLADPQ